MNKEEIINQLKEILNKYPDKQREILLYIFGRDNLIKMINEPTYEELQQENKQLKSQWRKLKEYLNYQSERAVGEDEYVYDEIYNEMQELEQGSDNQ